jgi:hemerythrin
MALFVWDNIYSIGDPSIDAQHQNLFDIANRFHEAHAIRSDRGTKMRIFDELIDYTARHFKDEEDFMRRHRYPGLERHQEQHVKLVKLVLNYKIRLERGDPDADHNAMEFIRLWLNGHILGSDRMIGEHAGVR